MLCNSNTDAFLVVKSCLVYHSLQADMLRAFFCRQTAEENVDDTLCDCENQSEPVPSQGILVVNKPVVGTELRFKVL